MQPAPLVFNLKELDSFRYRVEDTLKSVTVVAVKELRTAEIKREILNSAKLRTFFANNPNDLKALRHDKAIAHPIRQKDHLKHVPEYLIPVSMRSMVSVRGKKKKRRANKVSSSQEQRVKKSKMNDPLMQPQGSQNEAEGPIDIDDGADDADDAGETEQRVYTEKEVLGRSSSGRNQWKAKHKKGKFNPKTAKKNTHRVAGSFMKSKPFKG
jgi:ATP-dependent RNA helicase DDX56/DBP9